MKIHEKNFKRENNNEAFFFMDADATENRATKEEYTYDPWDEWDEDAREVYDNCPDDEMIEICYQKYINSGRIAFTYEDYVNTTFPWHGRPKGDFVELLLELKDLMEEEYPKTNQDVELLAERYPNAFKEFYRVPILVSKVVDRDSYFIEFDGRHRVLVAAMLDIDLPVKVMSYVKKSEISFEEYCDKAIFGPWKFFDREGKPLE